MKRWQIEERRLIFENPFVRVFLDRLLLPENIIIDGFCHFQFPDWVNVFALTRQNEVLLVRQYRHGLGEISLEVPAGKVEDHESPTLAILRELREETGFASDQEPILLKSMHSNPAITANYVHTYLLRDCEERFPQELDPTEQIEVVRMPFHLFQQAIDREEIDQHFTITAYYLAKHYLEELDER